VTVGLLRARVSTEKQRMGCELAQGRTAPRGRRISKRTGLAILLGGAGISLAVGVADLRASQRLIADGQVTNARVMDMHVERRRRSLDHFIDIEYRTAAGQVIRARDEVGSALFERVKVGDTMAVRYLADDPEEHALGASGRRETSMLWMAGLLSALAGIYLLFGS
jgi:hypothetical protein